MLMDSLSKLWFFPSMNCCGGRTVSWFVRTSNTDDHKLECFCLVHFKVIIQVWAYCLFNADQFRFLSIFLLTLHEWFLRFSEEYWNHIRYFMIHFNKCAIFEAIFRIKIGLCTEWRTFCVEVSPRGTENIWHLKYFRLFSSKMRSVRLCNMLLSRT